MKKLPELTLKQMGNAEVQKHSLIECIKTINALIELVKPNAKAAEEMKKHGIEPDLKTKEIELRKEMDELESEPEKKGPGRPKTK